MFKVNQLAKDLGMKNKEILAKIENSGINVKSYMATLEPDDFNVFFDELTRENQIKDLDGYLNGKTQIARKKKEEAPKAEVKEEAPAKTKSRTSMRSTARKRPYSRWTASCWPVDSPANKPHLCGRGH